MSFEGINVVEILQIGVIGLGFLLALFAYHLLTKEQRLKEPRPLIIRSIHVFMIFSIILCLIGVLSQTQGIFLDQDSKLISSDTSFEQGFKQKHEELLNEKTKLDIELVELNQNNEKLNSNLKSIIGKNEQLEDNFLRLKEKLGSCEKERVKLMGKDVNEITTCVNQTPANNSSFPTEPFWLESGVVKRLAKGVVLVSYNGVTSDLTITSGTKSNTFNVYNKVGRRFSFLYLNSTYFIDVLELKRFPHKLSVAIIHGGS